MNIFKKYSKVDNPKYSSYAGKTFYPEGGFGDFYGSYSSLDEIKESIESSGDDYDWCHVIDFKQTSRVLSGAREDVINRDSNGKFLSITSKWEWE